MLKRLIKLPIWLIIVVGSSGQSLNRQQETTVSEITGETHLSRQGREIKLTSIVIGSEPSVKTETESHSFLISGGLHGNETLTAEFVEWLTKRVSRGQSPLNRLPSGSKIDLLPRANPDSFGLSRYNRNYVNLNRNFGVLWGISSEPHGSSPFSEPETQALRRLMQVRQHVAAIDVHGYVNWIVAPSPPEMVSFREHPLARLYQAWVGSIKRNMNLLPGYELKRAGALGDGGSFEDWAFWDNRTLSICLEMRYPQRFAIARQPNQRIDSFRAYEAYIAKVFTDAIELHRNHLQLSSQTIAKLEPAKADSSKQQEGH